MEFEPRIYGKYFLLDKIATGGMAEVYKAKTYGVSGFERALVIKQILPHLTKDREFVEMFIDEAKISVELTHANIVQVYDLGKIGNNYFIAMEYIDGKDLRALLKKCHAEKQTLNVAHAVYLMIELLKGLEYAHKKRDPKSAQPLKIIHRDISPQNIMISYDGEVKIVDFGIAKAEYRLNETQAGVLKGKFGYMSPEQATGHEIDARSDLFSCGIILYEMLSARRLFLGENDLETLELIREADIPAITKYNPEVNPELEAIILKALAREPKDRYQDARTLQLELTKYMFKHHPNFTALDLAFFMKSLFEKECIEERERMTFALQTIEEKYKISDNTEVSDLALAPKDELSFVHPNPYTQETATLGGLTPKRPLSDLSTPSKATSSEVTGVMNSGKLPTQITELIALLKPWRLHLALAVGVLILLYAKFFGGEDLPKPLAKPTPTAAANVVKRATLSISSDPPGAQVYLQNKLIGTTPAAVRLEPDKDESFTFKLPGFNDKTMTVFVAAGDNAPLHVVLEKGEAAAVSMRLSSKPPGASVYINGEDSGKRTPYTFDGFSLGKEVAIKLHRQGYLPTEATIKLDQTQIDREFVLEARQGLITIETEPTGAAVTLNGRNIGKAPVQASVGMDQEYKVTAKLKGYQNLRQTVRLTEENETVQLRLTRAITENGYVSINADPWAVVYIDGELIGHTPIIRHALPYGEHQLDLQHTDYGSRKESIAVTKAHTQDQPLLIIRDLKGN